ncbi:helix-turn-helix domain-containing protein [Pseudoflavonifractor sp. 524-17]|uniref:DUF6017 domain-containing protein n=1 Tax=Pseudoflavonifractor sp. 524-17 TaxID=2304577 RepID=UPI00137A30AD|nr:DUF6017 domain-containing protein [Pseudoflavonifractor sp. 524-17]NCE66193.1 helix-turn-helix domain-containing protein [Pseudoflavonifractor sp. 524-17]
MAVFRVERTQNYTVMSNYHLRDKTLSLKAKGLLSLMLSLPENWDYTLAGLARISLEGKDAIRAAVVELEKAGYIHRSQTTDKTGKFSSNEYIIREYPANQTPPTEGPSAAQPSPENPTTEHPSTGSTQTENPTQIKKDPVKKEKKIMNSVSTDSFPFPSSPPVVVASSASPASPQAAKLTRCAAPPLSTETAALGFCGDPKMPAAAQPPEAKGRKRNRSSGMSQQAMNAYRELIRENICYDDFVQERPDDAGQLDEMVELMVEAVCSKKQSLRVAGNDFPQAVVKSRLLKLDDQHIRFVFDCLRENTTQVRNMKQYLLTVLYNAPVTMENHYAAQVNHDLYGGEAA